MCIGVFYIYIDNMQNNNFKCMFHPVVSLIQ